MVLQGPDWSLLKWKKLSLCVGVGGLSGVTVEVLPAAIMASASSESSCSVAPSLSGAVVVDKCSSQITVSFSRTAGWHVVTSDEYLDSGFVSEVTFLTTES